MREQGAAVMVEEVKRKIQANFEGCKATTPRPGRLIATIPSQALPSLLLLLKADGFEHLSLISCVDWIDEAELELSYHLWCYDKKIHAIVKTRIGRDSPRFLSIIPLFQHAQTYEREIHEMYGVRFEGNPRLTPLLLDHWQGPPPMRRDFDTRQYVQDTFAIIPPSRGLGDAYGKTSHAGNGENDAS